MSVEKAPNSLSKYPFHYPTLLFSLSIFAQSYMQLENLELSIIRFEKIKLETHNFAIKVDIKLTWSQDYSVCRVSNNLYLGTTTDSNGLHLEKKLQDTLLRYYLK